MHDCDVLLRVSALHKRYGRGRRAVHANRGISVSVKEGEVFGLLGHNGAGKTTLVNQVVGLARPSSGSVTLDGVDVVAHPAAGRRLCSVQAQSNVPISGLTPEAAIELVARMRGASPAQARTRSRQLVEALDLGSWARTPAQKVSGGIARLTAFSMAAAVPGRLVILDEPTNDVDPVRRRLLWQQIRRLADEGSAVLLVTHNVREAERAVDRLAVLDHGVVKASGTPAELISIHGSRLRLDVSPLGEAVLETPEWLQALQHSESRTSYSLHADNAALAAGWAQTMCERGLLGSFDLSTTSLEDVYVSLTDPEDADKTGEPSSPSQSTKEHA